MRLAAAPQRRCCGVAGKSAFGEGAELAPGGCGRGARGMGAHALIVACWLPPPPSAALGLCYALVQP